MNVAEARELLGVDKNSSYDCIKRAYKQKAKMYHPDSPSGSAEMFGKVKGAFDILKRNIIDSCINGANSTSVIIMSHKQLVEIYDKGSITLDSGEYIRKWDLGKYAVIVEVSWEVTYGEETTSYCELCRYKPFKMSKVDCRLNVEEDTPHIKVKVLDNEVETDIKLDNVSVVFKDRTPFELSVTINKVRS